MADFSRDSTMIEMFTFEMGQLTESLEQQIIESEGTEELSEGAVNEIFRIMHTLKGSAAMMMYNNISTVSHKIEDLFFYIREHKVSNIDYHELTDIVLEGNDFIKEELSKIENGMDSDGVGDDIINHAIAYLEQLKIANGEEPQYGASDPQITARQNTALLSAESSSKSGNSAPNSGQSGNVYEITISFEDGCEMENVRAYTVVRNLEVITNSIKYTPENITVDDNTKDEIRQNGFKMELVSDAEYDDVRKIIEDTVYLKNYKIKVLAANAHSGSETPASANESVGNSMAKKGSNNFNITIKFEDGCEMENVRAYTVTKNIEDIAESMTYYPDDILINEETAEIIRKKGFNIKLSTNYDYSHVEKILNDTVFLKELIITDESKAIKAAAVTSVISESTAGYTTKNLPLNITQNESVQKLENQHPAESPAKQSAEQQPNNAQKKSPGQTMISVNINKLDTLLNLTGELVTSEAMVTQNPDLHGLQLDSFNKATRQLRKIINDIQDTVMSMRMVPLSTTFLKMHRIVRDMCKSLNKDVQLELIGEETEVDKNIIEHISDPLMHIIRNSIDHGIETPEKRRDTGKEEKGTVILEAKNSGGDVLIIVKDDGAGINKEKVMEKAKKSGILKKPENEYTDREIFNFIFLPGFSTNENVTSYSGRGVGMDVVTTNIEQVGGSVIVDSEPGNSTTTTLKIPLTLAIINGMIIRLGNAIYTVPINSIKESFKAKEEDILTDPDGNEMIMVRGDVFNLMRLHNFFELSSQPLTVDDGILMMLEHDDQTIVVLVDELIGEQQVVVKAIPKYIKKPKGLSGCTLLGNGDISLIIDVQGFFNN